jgi:flagellar biosynthesis/type III secretory pathway protein FliH
MKYLPSEIEINGVTYYSGLELASKQLDWYNLGLAAGKSESYDKGWTDGYDTASIKYFDEYSVKLEEKYNSGYDAGKKEATLERVDQFNKGYEIGKYEGYEAGKKYIWFTADEIKQLHTDNEYTRKIWYAKGKEDGYVDAYNDGYEQCKHDSINKKEIPGEYLSHIEEARKEGYADGYKDCREVANCREVAKMLNKYGIDEDGPCNDCKEEPGRDDDDGEPIDDNQSEYDKGFTKGYEEGKSEGYAEGLDDGREVKLKQMPEHFAVPSSKETGSKTWNETIFGTGYNMGYNRGYKDGKTERPFTPFADWLNRK